MNILGLLGANGLPEWVTITVPIIKYVLLAYVVLAAIAIIILVMIQPSNSQGGMNALTGESETYYSHNKGATREGRMKRATIWIAVSVAIAVILYFVMQMIVAN